MYFQLRQVLTKELYEVEVTNKTVEGKVTGKDSKGVLINGTKYKVAAKTTPIQSTSAVRVYSILIQTAKLRRLTHQKL